METKVKAKLLVVSGSPKSDRGVVSEGSPKSDRSDIPSEVKANSQSGVEDGALELARAFMKAHGGLGRKCYKRGELSHLYVSTFPSWAPSDAQEDSSKKRPFKQVLFAMAHGLKVVRVVDRGRKLLWNRYRDNEGKQIERSDRYEKREGRHHRGHRGHRDHRDRYEKRDNRDHRDRYEKRDDRGHSDRYEEQGRSMSPEHRSYNGDRNNSHYSHGKRRYAQVKRRCYNCDMHGHIARDCDQPDRRKQSRSPSPKQTVDLSDMVKQDS